MWEGGDDRGDDGVGSVGKAGAEGRRRRRLWWQRLRLRRV